MIFEVHKSLFAFLFAVIICHPSKSCTYYEYDLWPVGATIKVAFKSKTVPRSYAKEIMRIASSYENYANIDFKLTFGDSAHIWIDHLPEESAWSKVGHQPHKSRGRSATMNLPLMMTYMRIKKYDESDYAYRKFQRNVLHEFGHALGLQHEHQNPLAEICWIEDELDDYCTDNGIGCGNYKAIDNLYRLKYSIYDRQSIMHYQIENEPLFCDYKSPYTYNLSSLDKRWVSIMYPFEGEVHADSEMIIELSSLKLSALNYTDELGFGRDLEIYGNISLISRRDIGEECYSDLSNCHYETHKSGNRVVEFLEKEVLILSWGDGKFSTSNLRRMTIGPNDEYFLHIHLREKDLFTNDDTYLYAQNALEHEGDILLPIENLYWKEDWTSSYMISERSRSRPQLRIDVDLSRIP